MEVVSGRRDHFMHPRARRYRPSPDCRSCHNSFLGLAIFGRGTRRSVVHVWGKVRAGIRLVDSVGGRGAVIAGALLLWYPLQGLATLSIELVAYFIVDGAAIILLALAHRRELAGRWEWMLVSGLRAPADRLIPLPLRGDGSTANPDDQSPGASGSEHAHGPFLPTPFSGWIVASFDHTHIGQTERIEAFGRMIEQRAARPIAAMHVSRSGGSRLAENFIGLAVDPGLFGR
ncbi:DUF308 domain-containing protein [uncultured Rhodoblastus sp.]|uniref:DUF308 domain-containing protein n=1 Tax=uncultured Rhodoblastus sp. TaxID=543037 RepID=UPI0025FA5D3C|nr:DUF308 domain-containing protein [uncultured Rhodoblastus sp.]